MVRIKFLSPVIKALKPFAGGVDPKHLVLEVTLPQPRGGRGLYVHMQTFAEVFGAGLAKASAAVGRSEYEGRTYVEVGRMSAGMALDEAQDALEMAETKRERTEAERAVKLAQALVDWND